MAKRGPKKALQWGQNDTKTNDFFGLIFFFLNSGGLSSICDCPQIRQESGINGTDVIVTTETPDTLESCIKKASAPLTCGLFLPHGEALDSEDRRFKKVGKFFLGLFAHFSIFLAFHFVRFCGKGICFQQFWLSCVFLFYHPVLVVPNVVYVLRTCHWTYSRLNLLFSYFDSTSSVWLLLKCSYWPPLSQGALAVGHVAMYWPTGGCAAGRKGHNWRVKRQKRVAKKVPWTVKKLDKS